MTLADATAAALAMHPDTPGVARLCQELLADLTGLPMGVPAVALCPLRTHGGYRAHNHWLEGQSFS